MVDDDKVTVEQLSAVHAVLQPTRVATEYDILITTAMERLRVGAASVADLTDYVRSVWGGADVDENRVRAAMGTAVAAGYCQIVESPEGWALTASGAAELAISRDWAAETWTRFRTELRDRAETAFGREVSEAEAVLWSGLIADSVNRAVAFGQDAFEGDVDLLSDQSLAPRSIDRSALFDELSRRAANPATSQVLAALAMEAVDPSSPFGNELVGHVTTGHMLHAFLARRDVLRHREAVGDLSGQRVVLDTPVLLTLLGPDSIARPVEAAITAAVRLGMQVIVPDHTFSELIEVVDRIERDYVDIIVRALREGADASVLAESVDEQVISFWLRGRAAGRFGHWSDFRDAARRLDGVLVRMGVVRRAHGNREMDRVAALKDALRGAPRGAAQLARDAHSAEMVWRSRRHASDGAFWPGGWFVSPDTHVRRAYRQVNRADPHPLALTVPQWIGLLSTFCPPASLDELARAAATSLAFDSMLLIAGKFPPKTAVQIAQALRGDPSAEVDARIAQLTIDQLMSELPQSGDPVTDGARVAASVAGLRSRRIDEAFTQAGGRMADEAGAAKRAAAADRRDAEQAHVRTSEAERRAEEAEDRAKAADARAERVERAGRRRLVLGVSIAALALVGGFLVYLGWTALGLGIAGAGATLFALGRDWAADPNTPHSKLFAALVAPTLGAIGTVLDALDVISI